MARRRRTGERSDLSLVLTAVVVGCWPRGAGGARLRGRGWSPAPHLCTAVSVSAQAPVGALAIDERQGGPVMLGGVDVRPLCGPTRRTRTPTARRWAWRNHFDSAAGARQAALSECSSRGGGSGCTVRMWGVQRPGGRGGAGSEPGRTAADPAGPSVGRFRPWGCGWSVRSADADGDWAL